MSNALTVPLPLTCMRSKRLNSDFCSPLLVNSICAIASLHSEHEVAFAQKDADPRLSRGQHFHDEALRLWLLEESRPTLTNVQALCILGLESSYRAKDRLGLTLVQIAAQLNDEVPLHGDEMRCAAQGVSERDFARARLSTHWMVKCNHAMLRIALMSGSTVESRISGLPKIDDTFDDSVAFWIGYPLTTDVVPYRPKSYLRKRCKLAGLFEEMHALLFVKNTQNNMSIRGFANAVGLLSAKMQHWYQHLLFELQYAWPMSVAVWELHACYLAFLMTLCLVARTKFQQDQKFVEDRSPSTEPDDENASFKARMAQDKLFEAIPLAHKAAQMLRDFRERYGFKITTAWLLQLQTVAAGVLVLDPRLADGTIATSPAARDGDETIQSSHAAFDEVFRCLLGAGVEVMIARGMARMMYHTALEREIALSKPTRRMLQLLSDSTWRPSDLALLENSNFPNFATTKGHEDRERMVELLSKWEKVEI